VSATTDLADLADCDLVIESVVEDLAVKKHLFTELDRTCGAATILASNTSTLPVVELAMETAGPTRCAGSTSSTRPGHDAGRDRAAHHRLARDDGRRPAFAETAARSQSR